MFPIAGNSLAFVVDYQGRVVVLGGCWPSVGHVHLLRVANNDVAVVSECRSTCPKRADTTTLVLEKWGDMLQGLEVVA